MLTPGPVPDRCHCPWDTASHPPVSFQRGLGLGWKIFPGQAAATRGDSGHRGGRDVSCLPRRRLAGGLVTDWFPSATAANYGAFCGLEQCRSWGPEALVGHPGLACPGLTGQHPCWRVGVVGFLMVAYTPWLVAPSSRAGTGRLQDSLTMSHLPSDLRITSGARGAYHLGICHHIRKVYFATENYIMANTGVRFLWETVILLITLGE